MHPRLIDLNADVGEGAGDDDAVLDAVTSVNIACGFHAGDAPTMRRLADRAAERGIAVGAHVSYLDRENFGRIAVDVSPDVLRDQVLYQIGALDAVCAAAGTTVRYVKPHGALYHAVNVAGADANALVDAVVDHGRGLRLLLAPDAAAADVARAAGLVSVPEGFADRGYTATGALVPRTGAGAVITREAEVVERALRLARHGVVRAVDGADVVVRCRSLCVHGDTPGAAALATAVRAALVAAGINVVPFA